MSLTVDEKKPTEKDEEFQKLYALLSGLSSKTNLKKEETIHSNNAIIPMISLMEVTNSSKSDSSKSTTPLTDRVRLNLNVETQLPAFQRTKPVQNFPPSPAPSSSSSKMEYNVHTESLLEHLRRTMEDKCKGLIEECIHDFKKANPSLLERDKPTAPPIRLKKKPVAGDLPKIAPPPKIANQCEGCFRILPDASALEYHFKIHRMCNKWKDVPNKDDYEIPTKSFHLMINDMVEASMMDEPMVCKYCHNRFSTKQIFRNHFNRAPVCNRMAWNAMKGFILNMSQFVPLPAIFTDDSDSSSQHSSIIHDDLSSFESLAEPKVPVAEPPMAEPKVPVAEPILQLIEIDI
jgi:hypothetical protein